jgi:hypothetical protein
VDTDPVTFVFADAKHLTVSAYILLAMLGNGMILVRLWVKGLMIYWDFIEIFA